jgi:hypothetical protein
MPALANVYWSRPLTPTRNDTHRGKGRRTLFILPPPGIFSDGIQRPEIPAERWIIARRSQVNVPACPRKTMFHSERAARKHTNHWSIGLFIPNPPRFSTCAAKLGCLESSRFCGGHAAAHSGQEASCGFQVRDPQPARYSGQRFSVQREQTAPCLLGLRLVVDA